MPHEDALFTVYKKRNLEAELQAEKQLEEVINKLPFNVQDRYKRALYIAQAMKTYDNPPSREHQEGGGSLSASGDLVIEPIKIEREHF